MSSTAVLDISAYAERVPVCSHAILVDVLTSLLNVVDLYIKRGDTCTEDYCNSIAACLAKLPQTTLSKSVVSKPKPPATPRLKKKPPPKKAPNEHVAVLSARYALFWTPTSGHPPSLGDILTRSASEYLSPFIRRAAVLFDIRVPLLNEAFSASVSSAFDCSTLTPSQEEMLSKISDVQVIDHWFKRQKREVVVKKEIARTDTQRQSLLGAALAQRVGIMIHSLKKSISNTATLRDVKKAILHCQMGKDELTLLIDSVPNEADPHSQRKAEEWKEAVKRVQEFQVAQPDVNLLEDEMCVLFLVAVPKLHERLQCMYITAAFGEIVCVVLQKLQLMTECLDMLTQHRGLHLTWLSLLRVGNLLNEGTSRGNQNFFRISSLRRAIDVRGNRGMTLPEYLAAFVGGIFDTSEWRQLQRARDANVFQTYSACKDVLDTYVTILGGESERGTTMPPTMSDESVMENLQDLLLIKMQEFAEKNLNVARLLVENLIHFMAKYAAAAIYFGDPETLLPLEKGVDGDFENEESQARDLFLRLTTFVIALRSKVKHNRVGSSLALETTNNEKASTIEYSARAARTQLLIQELKAMPSPNIPRTPSNKGGEDPDMPATPPLASEGVQMTPPTSERAQTPATEDALPSIPAPTEAQLKRDEPQPEPLTLATPFPITRPEDVQTLASEGPEDLKEIDEVATTIPAKPQKIYDRLASQRTARTASSVAASRVKSVHAPGKVAYYKHHRLAPNENVPPYRANSRLMSKLPLGLRAGSRLADEQTTLRRIRQQLLEEKDRVGAKMVPQSKVPLANTTRRVEPTGVRSISILPAQAPQAAGPARRRARGSIEAVFEFARSNVTGHNH